MSSTSLIVSKILPFSCVDGPGNRLVIFLQGCNYNCINCHNPHTIGHCTQCGDCIDTCEPKALNFTSLGNISFNESLCIDCDICTSNCAFNATPKVQTYTIEQLIEIIKKYHLFINGVTFSGGEATLQLKGLIALISKIKSTPELAQLSILIDTNGSLSTIGWNKLLPLIDGVMIDLKSWGNEVHKKITGKSNKRVFDSINLLAKYGKLQEIRLLIIPDVTDYMKYFDELTYYLSNIAKIQSNVLIRINAYRHHGVRREAIQIQECTAVYYNNFVKKLKNSSLDNIITSSYSCC